MNVVNDIVKVYIYSPCLDQDFYQKIIKYFKNFSPKNVNQSIITEKNLNRLIEEIVDHEKFSKLKIKVEAHESKNELKYRQDYHSDHPLVISLDVLNEKNWVFPDFKHFLNVITNLLLHPVKVLKNFRENDETNGNEFHIFESNLFRDVPNLYQDEAAMDVTHLALKLSLASCSKKYQPLTIHIRNDKYLGRSCLEIDFIFVPDTTLFGIHCTVFF